MAMMDRIKHENEIFSEAFIAEPVYMAELREYALEKHVPIVSKTVGNFLQLIIRLKKPKEVLEIGTGYGASGNLILESAGPHLHLDTVELNEDRYKFSYEHLKGNYGDQVRLFLDDARKETFWEERDKTYDMLFLDAAKGQYEFMINQAFDTCLAEDAVIILADIFINGWVVTGSYPNHRRKTSVLRMQKFLMNIKNDKRFYAHMFAVDDGILVLTQKGKIWH